MPAHRSEKLPVPGPWQAAARAAIVHLSAEAGLAASAVAVTRMEPLPADSGAGAFDVWLLAGGRTHRYRVHRDGSAVAPEPART
jgi:hypothetical protein